MDKVQKAVKMFKSGILSYWQVKEVLLVAGVKPSEVNKLIGRN